jgi:DNA-binding NtrC family response regulator
MLAMSTAAPTFRPGQSAGVLIASPNSFLRKKVASRLYARCGPVEEAMGGAEALDKLENSECQLLLLDQTLPDLDAHELAALIRLQYPGVDVLILDGDTGRAIAPDEFASSAAAHLIRALASDSTAETAEPVALPAVSRAGESIEPLPEMVGTSEAMQRVYRMVRLVAPRESAVLLTGESGTGKELVAQAIHRLSPRANRAYVVINCAAIPESLLESELFGYTRGAFTGAVQSRVGRIHAAQSGTLFLDEIGDLPLNLQSKLLRFLECGEVQRLGSPDVFRVDVRVIAATNADLQEKVAQGQFRKDLYYRLNVFPIELPALAQRRLDIAPLAEHFLQRAGRPLRLSAQAAEKLQQHTWPGNVRELRHVMERASILAGEGPLVLSEHIAISPSEFAVCVL